MRNILDANFNRLWKNKIFWFGILAAFILGIFTLYDGMTIQDEYRITMASIVFSGSKFVILMVAAFTGFFVGSEYSAGTMRNKIVSGHSRCSVYLANWLVCITVAAILHIFYLFVIILGGIIISPSVMTNPTLLALLALVSVLSVMAMSSIFLLISMLINNKPLVIALLLLISVGLVNYSVIIDERLHSPEYYEFSSWADEDGTIHDGGTYENPHYPTGIQRTYYEIMYDVLPDCQLTQIRDISISVWGQNGTVSAEQKQSLLLFCGYSALIIICCNTFGILLFRKKDLK